MPYRKLTDIVLKDGGPAELAVASGPTPEWQGRLCSFLNRPPQPEGPPLYAFLLTEEVPGLESRCFMALRDGKIVGCVVTTDAASVGYINSTYVNRGQRRLGIAGALMAALEEEFAGRGGKVRFLTTRSGSPAQSMFEKFGYQVRYERGGRTGMEKHYGGSTWEDYFSADPATLRVEDMTWAHWCSHRALMWNRTEGHRALGGGFLTRIRGSLGEGGTRWKALTTPDGRLFGDALLRPHDRWGGCPAAAHTRRLAGATGQGYVLDIYVHPRFRAATKTLFQAAMPQEGHVQTFLDGSSEEAIAFFLNQGFTLEASLRDDFHHHDPSTPDIRVYGKIV